MRGGKPKKKVTYQDVLDAPPHLIAEILEGELVLSPRPAAPHTCVNAALTLLLGERFHRGGKPGGWRILVEPELHLADDTVVPDICGWRLERMPYVQESATYFTLPPDWVCETASPWTERDDRTRKKRIYLRAGVEYLWFLHPINRTLEVLKRQRRTWVCIGDYTEDEKVRAKPFDDVELDLAELWRDFAPRPSRASELHRMYAGQNIVVPREG
jgi:Uma2 family endonuclease